MTTRAMSRLEKCLESENPLQREGAARWLLAIGLQKADRGVPSAFLASEAARQVKGRHSIHDVAAILAKHYNPGRFLVSGNAAKAGETDGFAQRTAEVLRDPEFHLTRSPLTGINRGLAQGCRGGGGHIRREPLEKTEWALGGVKVQYGCEGLAGTLKEMMREEALFSYEGLGKAETVRHLAGFVAGLWRLQAFARRNTLTVAVFTWKLVKARGFEADWRYFADHAWDFRVALARACHGDPGKGIGPTQEGLEAFFGNLLFGEKNELECGVPFSKRIRLKGGKRNRRTAEKMRRVERLVRLLDGEMSSVELMRKAGIGERSAFHRQYLQEALARGMIEMTHPEYPPHRSQKYRLTKKGRALLQKE